MLIIPNVVIQDQEFKFTYEFSDHTMQLHVSAVSDDGNHEFYFDIDNIQLLTKCAIIDLVYKKVEECLK